MKKRLGKLSILMGIAIISIPLLSYEAYSADNKCDGWNLNNGQWTYVKDGLAITNWFQDRDGKWYFFDNNGAMQTGWVLDKGNWYYMYGNGEMAHDCYVGSCYLNSNGAWTNSIPDSIKLNLDINSKMRDLGYSSVERIINYDNPDPRYLQGYRYIWNDGKEDNEEAASISVFDSGACSILIRKNSTIFNEELGKIFEFLFPGNGYRLLNEIDGIKEDKSENISGKHIDIKIFDDSIGIVIS